MCFYGSWEIMSEEAINNKLLDKLQTCYDTIYAGYECDLTDNILALRSVTARLHTRISSQDKQVREKTVCQLRKKKETIFPMLFSLLEQCNDTSACASIAGIIHESISPKSGSARLSILRYIVDANATCVMIRLLIQQSLNGVSITNPYLQEIVQILCQLSQRDVKFSGKVRQLKAAGIFHYYLKLCHQENNSKMIVAFLMITKTIARNISLIPVLMKDGIAKTMGHLLFVSSLAPSMKLKLLLNNLSYLSKDVGFCIRMVKAGALSVLLKIFSQWEKYDGKNRIKICVDAITTLQHICSTKSGKSAIRRENGFTPLYRFCLSCPEDKIYDKLLTKACLVINVCLQKKELPLPTVNSSLQFALPIPIPKDDYNDRGSDSDDEDDENCFENDDSDDNINDEDVDFVKYDEKKKVTEEVKNRTISAGRSDMYKVPRSESSSALLPNNGTTLPSIDVVHPVRAPPDPDELQRYKQFFTEYYNLLYNEAPSKSDSEIIRFDDGLIGENKKCREENNYSKGKMDNNVKTGIAVLDDVDLVNMTCRSSYSRIASSVRSVNSFVKVAYPDMMGGTGIGVLQPLYSKDRRVYRSKLVTNMEHGLHNNRIYNNVVFDLDKLIAESTMLSNIPKKLVNNDETRVGLKETALSTLSFESRFESGNLRKAIQVGPREYDLMLNTDVNSSHHSQWFYFEISNMDNVAPYVFNIINCEKSNSQFNCGMKPLIYSVREATLGRSGWLRMGTDICYYRNTYKIPEVSRRDTYQTATFSIKFLHSLDVCYMAYTFPYTYSQLLNRTKNWLKNNDSRYIYFRVDNLCKSLNHNDVPLFTITAPDDRNHRLVDREIIFLTCRVHPGESNSSWVMDGTISYLLEQTAVANKLRKQYVFKVVPMLNVEGVINGCHRCGLTNEDLNRKWSNPDPKLHPTIYATKALLYYSVKIMKKTPYLYCDYHGHSRRKNVFFFGCSNQESWLESDRNIPNVGIDHLLLGHLMQNCSTAFCNDMCDYKVERNRESTARVTVWREFGVKRSYTMETSYCGCDRGPYKGYHFDTTQFQEIGTNFCIAVACLYDETRWRMTMMMADQENNNFRCKFSNRAELPPTVSSNESYVTGEDEETENPEESSFFTD